MFVNYLESDDVFRPEGLALSPCHAPEVFL